MGVSREARQSKRCVGCYSRLDPVCILMKYFLTDSVGMESSVDSVEPGFLVWSPIVEEAEVCFFCGCVEPKVLEIGSYSWVQLLSLC